CFFGILNVCEEFTLSASELAIVSPITDSVLTAFSSLDYSAIAAGIFPLKR
ncbi:hypothetical protein SAMN05216477_1214, partial [Streptococcus equinus]